MREVELTCLLEAARVFSTLASFSSYSFCMAVAPPRPSSLSL